MVYLEGPFKLLRISWGPVYWSSRGTGKISCHWWSLLIIIAIRVTRERVKEAQDRKKKKLRN
jgi:hypothetical protein